MSTARQLYLSTNLHVNHYRLDSSRHLEQYLPSVTPAYPIPFALTAFVSTHPLLSKHANTISYPSNSYPILSFRSNPPPSRSEPNASQAIRSVSLLIPPSFAGVDTKSVIDRRFGSKIPTTLRIRLVKSGLEEGEDAVVGRGTLHSKEA